MLERRYFREPIQEIFDAARYLDAGVSAHLAGRTKIADQLFRFANDPKVWEWTDSIWGSNSQYVTVNKQTALHSKPKAINRMPNVAMKRALHERDGYHCRFCEIPVIHPDIRKHLHLLYPDAIPWGNKNATQHAGFQCMWLQYDHVVPHSAGGENKLENLIIACSACNYGKMNYTLEELGLLDPRNFNPVQSSWDGLERVKNA